MSALSNVKWVAVSQAVRILSQLANLFLLARLLPPSDYGLMAMATVVTNFALLLKDQGTSAVLIQKEMLSNRTITTIFWFNIIIGLVIAFSIIGFSSAISIYFKQPQLIPILCSLAIVFPISSSASSHQSLLERNSEFKKLAIIEIISSTLAMIAAVIAAIQGWGVYSLVLQALLISLLSSIQIWSISTWRPDGKPSFEEMKSILPFTSHMTGFQLITYFFRNMDSIIIGRMLGVASLGTYSMAYKIMLLPVQNITWAASRALYPVMSRQQTALNEMGQLYLQTISLIAFITAPLMAGIFALREIFVAVAFGNHWLNVAGVLAWLAPVGFIQSISSTTGTVFMALGKTKVLMYFALFSAFVHITAYFIGSAWGLEGVAEAYLIAALFTALPALAIAAKFVGLSIFDVFNEIKRSIIVSILLCITLRFCYTKFSGMWGSDILEFSILVLIGILLYFLLSIFFFKQQTVNFFNKLKAA